MAKTIIMPRFGMTQEEATIVKWIRHEGDQVETGDPICEVTTDKVNMEVEASADGLLAGIRFPEGATVPVTEVIAYIVAEGEMLKEHEIHEEKGQAQPAAGSLVPGVASEPVVAESQPNLEIKATPVARRMASAEGIDLAAVVGSGQEGQITRQDVERFLVSRSGLIPSAESAKVRATPAARRLAREGQIHLTRVAGSGPQGRVQGWDVRAAGEKAAPRPPSPELLGGEQPLAIKLEGMRHTIAQRMLSSWQQIPHILFTLDIDMTRAIAMREQFNARYDGERRSVSMTAVLVKACAAALRLHPRLNCYFKGSMPSKTYDGIETRDDQLWIMPEVNIGVAVALEEGLIVPVVRSADTKSLYQIGQEVSDLSRRAREGSLRPEDVVDGTFTLSNLGMFGVDHFTAIINPPQVAILATGRIARRYVPDEAERPSLRDMMTVTLSADHRAVDGTGAARFLTELKAILETAGVQWG